MADRNSILRGIIGAMKGVSEVQQAQNKLKMHLLETSEKYQNDFFQTMQKQKLEQQGKMEMGPWDIQQKRLEAEATANIPRNAPMSNKDRIYQNISKIPEDQWNPLQRKFMENYMGGGEQEVRDPDTGEVLYTAPKGFKFKPRPPKGKTTAGEDTSFLGGETQRDIIERPSISGDQTSGLQSKVEQARAAGYSDEEINAYLKGQ